MKIVTTIRVALATAVAVAFAIAASAPADAGHRHPVEGLAHEYRDAVLDFERIVFRSRYYEGGYERIADALEDSSGRLRSASRRLDRPSDLFRRFNETAALHQNVAATFFGPNPYRPCVKTYGQLNVAWSRVDAVFAQLAGAIDQLRYGGYGSARVSIPAITAPVGGCSTGLGGGYDLYRSRSIDPFSRPYGLTQPPLQQRLPSDRRAPIVHPISRGGLGDYFGPSTRPDYRDLYRRPYSFGTNRGIGANVYRQ